MFRQLTLIPSKNDFGQLAELSLFYDKVYFEFDEQFFNELKRKIKPQKFIEFLLENEDNFFPFYRYSRPFVNVWFPNSKDPVHRNHIFIKTGGYDSVGDRDFLLDYCSNYKPFGSATQKFIEKVDVQYAHKEILKIVFDELENGSLIEFISKETDISLKTLSKEIVFEEANGEIAVRIGKLELSPIENAISKYLVVLDYTLECIKSNSDYITNMTEVDSIDNSLKALINQSKLNEFKQFALTDVPSIREVINKGDKSLDDFINLYSKATKFKNWLSNINDDELLIKRYFEDTLRCTWSDKLPNKTFRWSLFTGAGIGIDALGFGGIGTATGLAIGAFDTFILDKIINGWKPNQFIEQIGKFSKLNNR